LYFVFIAPRVEQQCSSYSPLRRYLRYFFVSDYVDVPHGLVPASGADQLPQSDERVRTVPPLSRPQAERGSP
jgi:hypothetical protein